MDNIAITDVAIGLLVANANLKNENYNIILYATINLIQYFNIILDLVWNLEFNKRLFYYIASISIVSGTLSSLTDASIKTDKIEPTSAINLISSGIVFSDWIAKLAI
ncbi:3455_t:CDS:1, partial [Funneliformis geosporum]